MKTRTLLIVCSLSTVSLAAATSAQSFAQSTAGSAVSTHPTLPRGSAHLDLSSLEFESYGMLTAHVREAGPFGFWLFSQPGTSPQFDPGLALFVGNAPTGRDGEGMLSFPFRVRDPVLIEPEAMFFAVYRATDGITYVSERAPFSTAPMPRAVLDFNRDTLGFNIPAGTEIRDQWAEVGIRISATNNTPGHPDKAIIYDSSDPLGADPDLMTPGSGFMNNRAYGKLLIIAENDVDANGDGLVDRPDDEAAGGVLTFTFREPVQVYMAVLVDVDMNEVAKVSCFEAGRLVQDLQVPSMGNNSVERFGLGAEKLTRFDIALTGSGALAELWVVDKRIPRMVYPADDRLSESP